MNIGHMTLRIARWIVISVAAVNVAFSITEGKVGSIFNVVLSAVLYLTVIEVLWRSWRAVRRSPAVAPARALNKDDNSVTWSQRDSLRPCKERQGWLTDNENVRMNPATGWFMTGPLDAGGNFYGESEHD